MTLQEYGARRPRPLTRSLRDRPLPVGGGLSRSATLWEIAGTRLDRMDCNSFGPVCWGRRSLLRINNLGRRLLNWLAAAIIVEFWTGERSPAGSHADASDPLCRFS
jgi:hypothetical protein